MLTIHKALRPHGSFRVVQGQGMGQLQLFREGQSQGLSPVVVFEESTTVGDVRVLDAVLAIVSLVVDAVGRGSAPTMASASKYLLVGNK